MITDIEDYFTKGCDRCARFATPDCSAALWRPGLLALRDICRAAGLVETVKWAHPCYMHADRNIAVMGAFRDNFRLTFFNAALMKDPDDLLERQGPNTQTPNMIRFTSNDAPEKMAATITAYLKEAMGYAADGILPPKNTTMPDLPDELADALDSDPELSEAYAALTPGRQKSYIININGAKQAQTRINRIAKFRDKIIAGKGATER